MRHVWVCGCGAKLNLYFACGSRKKQEWNKRKFVLWRKEHKFHYAYLSDLK
jgi:hypothetical protein